MVLCVAKMAKPKGAGCLRQKVGFARRSEVDDGAGNRRGEWSGLDIERSASLTPTRGGESVQAARLSGSATWDLWVRNDSQVRTITTADRVYDARQPLRTFNIVFGPEDMDGDGHWLFLQLTSGGGDG